MKKFKNKVILVTGGASGMGADNVKRFVEEGGKVYFTDVNVKDGKILAEKLGSQAIFLQHDVSSNEDWLRVVDLIKSQDNKLDVLVNNAGIASIMSFDEMSLEEYMKVININQISVFLGMKHALSLLKKSGSGSIINISSIAGLNGAPGRAAYSSSKYAVRGLSKSAALEFAPFNIRVNSVHPGIIETPMVMKEGYEDMLAEMAKTIPLERMGKSKDLTNLVVFLASEDSSYCTASEFIVDGGYSSRA